ncbi:TIGR03773 family transporter-associated surface protein [Actinoplanes sp. NPDC023714]|uniref:TIGR03773 family transporter-associated surface protein n=1 Tax=Actinoplanes sp. NPDC023714 TaxID=3154322 RepID=UPI003408CE33
MNKPDLRRAAAVAAASLAVTLGTGTPAVAAGPEADGADLVSFSVESGQLRMSFRGAGEGGEDPQSVRFSTSASPAGVVPDDPDFAFLGRPGTPVWSLQDGSPFSTFDTTAIDGGPVTLELASVEGPGAFAAYRLSAWGRPTLLLDSDGRTSTRLPAGQRLGGVVWLFDAAGEYRVTLRAVAGTSSDVATYRVEVPQGDQSGEAAPEAGAPGVGLPRRAGATAGDGGERGASVVPKKGTVTTAQAAASRRVIADGHVDMGPQLDGDALAVKLKDDSTTPPTWRELADVVLKVTDKALIDVPAGAGYAFLGTAGDKVYLLPQSQQAGIVWPGWNTQHASVVEGTRGNVTWRLKEVSGPGAFKLFLTGSFGTPEVIFDSAKRLPQQLGVAPNTHAHGNWAFTEAGTYRLSVEMSATTTAGKTVSDTKVLVLAVGDATQTGADNGEGGPSENTGKGEDTGKGEGAGIGSDGSGEGTDEGSTGGGNLARTGANVMSVAGGGALLLIGGTTAVILARRRRDEAAPE